MIPNRTVNNGDRQGSHDGAQVLQETVQMLASLNIAGSEQPQQQPPQQQQQRRGNGATQGIRQQQNALVSIIGRKQIHMDINMDDLPPVPQISNLKTLDANLPRICSNIFKVLKSKQLEATYQNCLVVDLKKAGVEIIGTEVEIEIMYKNERVGSRRADIILRVSSGELVILELKAVGTLTTDHLTQLQYYMHHFGIGRGYLINFPHDTGFPDIDKTFSQQTLCGNDSSPLSDRRVRDKHANDSVRIIKVEPINN